MIPHARGTNGRVVASFFLVVALVHCDRGEKSAKGSVASSSSAPARALPSASASARPASSSAPPFAVNRAPTGEGDDFLIEVPKLTVDSPPAASDAGTARRGCSLELTKADIPRQKLERRASSGDPCAKSALVSKLLSGRPSEGDFRRALRFAIEAQDAGADVRECFLFDFAHDGPRLATCAERGGNALLLSLLIVSGFGVPRDLDRARELVERDEFRACGHDQVKAIIEAERAHPTAKRYAYCRDGACTSLEWQGCYAERKHRYEWMSSALRAKLTQAAGPHRKDYERLLALFGDFVEQDSKHVYLGSDSLFSNAKARNQELALKRRFDALLERVLVEKKLPEASDAEIASLQRRLHDLDGLALKRTSPSDPPVAHRYAVAYLSADKAYQMLEQSFVGFCTITLGTDRAVAARAALLRLRAETLEAAGQP